LGAEISGIDLSRPLTADELSAIQDAFSRRLVLLFRGQDLTPAQQVAFTRNFGEVEPHPLGSRRPAEGQPEVLVLENKPGRPGARNDFWHSDLSYVVEPPGASVLHSRITTEGCADTMFCNMYAALEDLSPAMQRMLAPLSALHSAEALVRRNNESRSDGQPIEAVPPAVEHPVVRTHPATGRRALYVNPYYTTRFAGMSEAESRPLLDFLCSRATRPENVYRHHWRQGDVLMWDNRCTMHYAVYDYDGTMPRLMHRTTAKGERPRY
jgi:taurine dioxygenase